MLRFVSHAADASFVVDQMIADPDSNHDN